MQITITGRVFLSPSSRFLPNVRVELWDNQGTYGWIASTNTDANGNYTFIVPDPIATVINSGNVIPLYKVYVADRLLISQSLPYSQESIILNVAQNVYDAALPDTTTATDSQLTYVYIQGKVVDSNNTPASGLTINVYENGFRNRVLLATVMPNANGSFKAKLSTKDINNIPVSAQRSLWVEAVANGSVVVATSGDIFSWSDTITVNLVASAYTPPSEYMNVLQSATTIIGGADISTLISDTKTNTNEFGYVAGAAGKHPIDIQLVSKAHVHANETGLNPELMYALVKTAGIDNVDNPLLKMREQDIRDAISSAISSNTISTYTQGDIDNFVTGAKNYQVIATKGIQVDNESFTLNDVLVSVFNSDSDATNFLNVYNTQEYTQLSDFWTAYESSYGVDMKLKAQTGMQLAAVTSYQPQLIAELISTVPSGDISSLATWDTSQWYSVINNLCNTHQVLCVPAAIRGDVTDYTNTEVQNQYASTLTNIMQNMYPLVNINATLQGQSGRTLIADPTTLNDVITFIKQNTSFDLRVQSIHDVNATDYDLTGVSDVTTLQAGLAPFQRVLRVTLGNPSAVMQLVASGLTSAKAIAEMGEETFVSKYSGILGGTDSAAAAFSKATTMTLLAGHYTVDTITNARATAGTTVIPYTKINDTSGISAAEPDLVTMFGNLDYCSCDQCMSMYSPAAYLTDMLNFLRTNGSASAAYSELLHRRPDLAYIDLSCKNTNTPLPYIDLVNELLELQVLRNASVSGVPASFQTSGTAEQLAAYPEHTQKYVVAAGSPPEYGYESYNGYSVVYDGGSGVTGLANAVYPYNLPFSLAIEETRTYLQYLGISRYDIMRLFTKHNYSGTDASAINEVTVYNTYCELLGLTKDAADIITLASSRDTIDNAKPWLFYGIDAENNVYPNTQKGVQDPVNSANRIKGDWATAILAARVDVFLQQTGITYQELLEFMITDFLNPIVHGNRNVSITAVQGADADTCQLDKLQFVFTSPETAAHFFGKFYRFLRLYRTNTLSIYQWDILLRSLQITNLDSTLDSLHGNTLPFILIGRVLELSKVLKIAPEKLAAFWNDIDTTSYIDYSTDSLDVIPSVYSSIFDSKGVINDPSYTIFSDPASLSSLTYEDNTAQIGSFCNISEDDILSLLDYLSVGLSDSMNLTILSRIYFLAEFAKAVGYSIQDLIIHLTLSSISTSYIISNPSSAYTSGYSYSSATTILENVLFERYGINAVKQSQFTISEYNYLAGNIDPNLEYIPVASDINLFYDGLRTELLKYPVYNDPASSDPDVVEAAQQVLNQLANVVYQQFSKQFNIPSQWVSDIFDPSPLMTSSTPSTSFTMKLLKDGLFQSTASSLDESTDTEAYYEQYRLVSKISFIFLRLNLQTKDFEYLFKNPTILELSFDFNTLYVQADTSGSFAPLPNPTAVYQFRALVMLSAFVNVRDRLTLPDGALAELLSLDYTSAATSPSTAKQNWLDFFNKYTTWGSMLIDLVGDDTVITPTAGSNTNLLMTTFPTSFAPTYNIDIVMQIADIVFWCERTGLNPNSLYKVLRSDLQLADSHKILLAAKGKHTDEEWGKIAKPLRDPIRKKQRDALVGYLLANDSGSNVYPWRNANDLFAYLLIDVETNPPVLTSRIKQAISSTQLFIDRVMMSLEYSGGSLSAPITVSQEFMDQWSEWRKWYRIWNANREIFLYPENYLDPTLRDDRTTFFEDFQTELLQADVTADSVENAMRNYLQKLEEVARLEPVGACDMRDADGRAVTYAFARTSGHPQHYYYRKLVDELWTGWEKMDMEIQGDHIMPVVWDNRVYVFWLTFVEKKIKANIENFNVITNPDDASTGTGGTHCGWFYNDPDANNETSAVNEDDTSKAKYYHQLDISLNWTELKDGKWQKQKVGTNSIKMNVNPFLPATFTYKDANHTLATQYALKKNPFGVKPKYDIITKNWSYSAEEVVKSRYYMYPTGGATLTSDGSSTLKINLLFHNGIMSSEDMVMSYSNAFIFSDPNSEPDVWDGQGSLTPVQVVPKGTLNSNMNLLRFSSGNGPLYVDDGYKVQSANVYNYIKEGQDPSTAMQATLIKVRNTSSEILAQTPNGAYKVRCQSNFQQNPLEDKFFFTDDVNTFFVRHIQQPIGIILAQSGQTATYAPNNSSTGFSSVSVYNGTALTVNPATGMTGGGGTSYLFDPHGINTGNAVLVPSYPMTPVFFTPKPAYYYFQTFYHPHVNDFIKALNRKGIDGLLNISQQVNGDTMFFNTEYQPTSLVYNSASHVYPTNIVDFSYNAAYSIYNWELFYHIPMLIAQSLSTNMKFEEAQKWYHYIFNPTSNTDDKGNISYTRQRFWKFRPFFDLANPSNQIQTLSELLDQIHNNNADAVAQVHMMADDPFQPYAIARMRQLAFMKNTVMKYLDNLIAWGDYLFTQDTIESINEATQLYVLASNILGEKPERIPRRAIAEPDSFNDLVTYGGIDAFGNAKVEIENYIDVNAGVPGGGVRTSLEYTVPVMFYFCTPENSQLLGYWDTIADRLFKIRNSLNIKGQAQQLPLFQPPINPMLLVRAAAAGVDISSVLNDISGANLPYYRFNHMLQKANELCSDVKALGGALLSALEKKDAENLSLLRSGLESTLLKSMLQMKKRQLDETNANLEALNRSREITQAKLEYYSSRQFQNAREQEHISTLYNTIGLQSTQAVLQGIISGVSIIPQFHIQAPFAVGPALGGMQIANILQAISSQLGYSVAMKNTSASIAATVGGYERRMDDWKFQVTTAQKELNQIDQQIVAAQIRIDIAQRDVDSQQIQIDNNKATDDFMRSKFTNNELYSWMITQISTTYFQAYQLAYSYAKKAGQCYDYELPYASQPSSQFITFGYWDSLKKGLLAGEKLQYDLRKLEASYIDNNLRELELTKHISLAMLNPDSLVALREDGQCTFDIPLWPFALDFPGHYMRRIKSVSITIPCVAGPYTTIAAELALTTNKVWGMEDPLSVSSPTPVSSSNIGGMIATSSAQNDSGLFQLNFHDERYLPFEGKGVDSSWSLTLMKDSALRQFDFNTISDVIIHLKYTAQDEGEGTHYTSRVTALKDIIDGTSAAMPRYTSMKHEYSNEWNAAFSQLTTTAASNDVARPLTFSLSHDQFPYYCKGKTVNVKSATFYMVPSDTNSTPSFNIEYLSNGNSGTLGTMHFTDGSGSYGYVDGATFGGSSGLALSEGGSLEFDMKLYQLNGSTEEVANETAIEDIYVVFTYTLS